MRGPTLQDDARPDVRDIACRIEPSPRRIVPTQQQQGIVSEFEKNGLGPTVKSWVGTGPNQPISPDQVHKALGPDLMRQLSEKSGLSVEDLAQKLSQVLPEVVDKLTPDGTIPKTS